MVNLFNPSTTADSDTAGKETPMVTPILSNATVGKLGPRQALSGRLAANRQLRGVAIIGALVLALAASLALGRALQSDQAGSEASLQIVGDGPGFTAYSEDHRSAAATLVPGFAETREDHQLPVVATVPGFTDYREDHQSDLAGESDTTGSTTGITARAAAAAAGIGYLEFFPGEEFAGVNRPARGATGTGPLEFLPGEGLTGSFSRIPTVAGIGPIEFLPSEQDASAVPSLAPDHEPAPLFGPQP